MDKLISLEPSNVIAIRIEPDQKCFGEMILRNVMHTMPVAFRLQPMNKTCYQVRPQSGIIPPLTAVSVEISYVLTPDSALPESFPHSDDSFILHSVVVPGAVFKDPSSTFDTVPNDCFSAKKKQVFVDSNIGVAFVGSVVLAQLVTKGLIKEVEQVLKLSDSAWHSADAVDAHGRTLLHLAIAQSRTDLVKLLLKHKPDVEARNQTGQTPLETAVAAGDLLNVQLLLACQASTRRSGSSKWGSIHLAVLGGGHVEILKLLLLKGADIDTLTEDGCTALHLAVEERQRDCAKLLLSSGAKLDVGRAADGETPLHVAASLGDEGMIKLLLHMGANKDILDQLGRTAYDIAAQHGHKQLFDVLKLGDSLCAAARKGEVRTIQWLLQNGASVNAVDQHGWTALHRASFKGQVYTVRTLIEKGVDIDAKDKDGYTPLHCASESGKAEVIEVLVKKGADIEAKTNKGTTAQKIADTLQHTTISRILAKGGNNIDRVVHIAVSKPSVFDNSRSAVDPTIEDLKKRPRRKRVHRRSFDKLRPPLAVL